MPRTVKRPKNDLVEKLRRAMRGYAVRIADIETELLPAIDLDPFGDDWIDVDDGDVSLS